MILKWFAAGEAERFGLELAGFLMKELSGTVDKRGAKFTARAEKVLVQADRRVREFALRERMNVYKRGKLANSFLWALKDAGCPPDYAQELTEWLTLRL